MTPRHPPRMGDISATEVRARAEMARTYLAIAEREYELVRDDASGLSTASAVGALCVMAGFAASDAICGHVDKQRPRGQDHVQAVTVLAGIRGAGEAATALRRLLADKDTAQYGTTFLSADKAREMLRRARAMLQVMEPLLVQGP